MPRPPFARFLVRDLSMAPTLLPGDRLLLWCWGGPRSGDLLVVEDPQRPGAYLVKRATRVADARVWVEGDNRAASRDSRAFGALTRARVVGRVIWRYLPGARRGRPVAG